VERDDWSLRGPMVGGIDINHAIIDPRDGRLYATVNNPWFGPQVQFSDDLGETWTEVTSNPRFSGDPVADAENPWFFQEAKIMDRLWRIEPGPASSPRTIYCGVAPAALFESTDGGATWHENSGLSAPPTRPGWQPSKGGPAMHPGAPDPGNPGRRWLA